MKKYSNLFLLGLASAVVVACNGGGTSSSASAPTQPVAMPSSSWVNTGLDSFLATNNLTKRGLSVTLDGTALYTYTAESSLRRHVLSFNTTTKMWSDITGNLPAVVFSTSSTDFGAPSTNNNGMVYWSSTRGFYLYTGNSTWESISLPAPYTFNGIALVAQKTRSVILFGRTATTLPASLQPYKLNTDTTLTAINSSTNLAVGDTLNSFSISPNESYYALRYTNATGSHVAINGESATIPKFSGGFYTSSLSVNGYMYFSNESSIAVCTPGSCSMVTSQQSIVPNNTITNITPLATAGDFALSLSESGTGLVKAYICDAITCTLQGNTVESQTSFSFNPYVANPSATAYGQTTGFYWLANSLWTNLAPTINDGYAFVDENVVRVACSYSVGTPLVRFGGNDDAFNNLVEQVFVNTASSWQDISLPALAGQRMYYDRLYSNTNPNNGASTFAGIYGVSLSESTNAEQNSIATNLWIYPQNIVCPALY